MSLDSPSELKIDGSQLKIAIVAARFNQSLVDTMVQHAYETLATAQVANILIERVPGSAEIPFATATLAQSEDFDAIIAIGLVIAGATNHHNVIGDSCAITMHQIAIDTATPVINGITVVNNQQQAEERAGPKINRGKEFALAALEMTQFTKKWKTTNPQK